MPLPTAFPTPTAPASFQAIPAYQPREAVTADAPDPMREQLAGMEGQIAERYQQLQQPLTPDGAALKSEFFRDRDRIRDMQTQGYPQEHVADYMGQMLQKLDSRWSDTYVQKTPIASELWPQHSVTLPDGRLFTMHVRNGAPDFRQAKDLEAKDAGAAGDQGSLDTLQAEQPNPLPPTVGAPVDEPPAGAKVHAPRNEAEWKTVPEGEWWVDGAGVKRRKPTRQDMMEASQRQQFGDEYFQWIKENKVRLQRNNKDGRWEIDKDAWAVQQKMDEAKRKPEEARLKANTLTAVQVETNRSSRLDAIGKWNERREKYRDTLEAKKDVSELSDEQIDAKVEKLYPANSAPKLYDEDLRTNRWVEQPDGSWVKQSPPPAAAPTAPPTAGPQGATTQPAAGPAAPASQPAAQQPTALPPGMPPGAVANPDGTISFPDPNNPSKRITIRRKSS